MPSPLVNTLEPLFLKMKAIQRRVIDFPLGLGNVHRGILSYYSCHLNRDGDVDGVEGMLMEAWHSLCQHTDYSVQTRLTLIKPEQ